MRDVRAGIARAVVDIGEDADVFPAQMVTIGAGHRGEPIAGSISSHDAADEDLDADKAGSHSMRHSQGSPGIVGLDNDAELQLRKFGTQQSSERAHDRQGFRRGRGDLARGILQHQGWHAGFCEDGRVGKNIVFELGHGRAARNSEIRQVQGGNDERCRVEKGDRRLCLRRCGHHRSSIGPVGVGYPSVSIRRSSSVARGTSEEM